jgi:pimeloyl-ACP methyl ester carboxylesterase
VLCPTLVLSAGKDPMSAVAETIHKLTPDSKLNIIKDGPIDLNRVWPREFAEAVLEFLNSTPG